MGESQSDRAIIFDTTLRDAEQTPGASLSVREKLEIAHQLAKLKVDIVEAGFPISSVEDFEAVNRVAREISGPAICGLARALPGDIDRAGEALKDAPKPRLHTFIGTSASHMEMMTKSPDEVLKMSAAAVERAKTFCEDVEFSPMDAARSEPAYLYEVIEAAVQAGATTINIPDTVGYAVPEGFGGLIRDILEHVPGIEKAVLSVHCHDDLGMAVSNTLTAMKNGARQAECTINGLGERAGNASLEEVVMALRTRQDYFGLSTEIETREICPTSRLVSRLMGIVVPPNKAIVGANAFAHSSGIHQDGVLKERMTFEIMAPQDVGLEATQIVLTARSGRHALRHRLEKLGFQLSKEDLDQAYQRFIDIADKKKEVFDEDLVVIVSDEVHDVPQKYTLEYLHTSSGTGTLPTATVKLSIDQESVVQEAAWGDGPIDATYNAIKKAVGIPVELENYDSRSVTGGQDAVGEVRVRLAKDGLTATGRGASTDLIEAGARAFVDGLNRLVALEQRRGGASQVRDTV